MGRRPTTGKFQTREELIETILDLHHNAGQKVIQIAHTCGVSNPTVHRIIAEHPRTKKAKAKLEPRPRTKPEPKPRTKSESIEGLMVLVFPKS